MYGATVGRDEGQSRGQREGPCCRTQTPDHLLTTVLAAEYLFRPGTVRAPSQAGLTSHEVRSPLSPSITRKENQGSKGLRTYFEVRLNSGHYPPQLTLV